MKTWYEIYYSLNNSTLQIVGLGTLSDTKVSALVGGQRKLLSVALGLVSEPNILFLDEPTTGMCSWGVSIWRYVLQRMSCVLVSVLVSRYIFCCVTESASMCVCTYLN